MDSRNPYCHSSTFIDLLNSQQDSVHEPFPFPSSQVPAFSTQRNEDASFFEETNAERRERRKWTHKDDILLISSWLNTSKDPIACNEQKSVAFWKRIADYYVASPHALGLEKREPDHCKQRWQKINLTVGKFCGAYEAAKRERASGQNENDVLKRAHEIFKNDYKKVLNLEHAWNELRHDQKWCELSTGKCEGSSKRRKGEDSAQSSSSHVDQPTNRPQGVKAAKGRGKKSVEEDKALVGFQSMWTIREKELAAK